MPEYLSPGVYVEEVSFRSKSIEAVSTSTTGFAGMTRTGPVCYDGGPVECEPRLVTSFTEFERVYGGLEPLNLAGDEVPCYLALAARAFFLNGGQRLYVSRVFNDNTDDGVASRDVAVGGGTVTWRARWPGSFGNVLVTTTYFRSRNVAYDDGGTIQARQARRGTLVEIISAGDPAPTNDDPLDPTDLAALAVPITSTLAVVEVDADGVQTFLTDSTPTTVTPNPGDVIQIVHLNVTVSVDAGRVDFYDELAAHPSHNRFIGRILAADDPADQDGVVWLDEDVAGAADPITEAIDLALGLTSATNGRLEGGNDGVMIAAEGEFGLAGREADPDDVTMKATGLQALAEIDDIAIVAAPDVGGMDEASRLVATSHLLAHAEAPAAYRIAVVDGPPSASINEIREFRGQFDSTYGALYHPWINILDPNDLGAPGTPPRQMSVPPSGFVCGIYARTDVARGVHKAPANEVVRGLTRFEININKRRQDVLNPEGINALRLLEGRGNRVWGARTMTSDPEWKYVNVRRLLIMIEHSIDRSTQWAVFEPNNERLWGNVRRTVEDFLLVLWKDGALMGTSPEEAFFVRCDRTTMTQNDIDNGRLICLVGVAPTKPAEFVIFRIGQWTGDATV